MSLRYSPTGDFRQLPRQGALTTNDVYRPLDGFTIDQHAAEFDKLPCLVQQRNLSCDDKQNGRFYSRTMERHNWESLASRLVWAMKKRGWKDKDVAKEINRRHDMGLAWQTIQSVRMGKTGMSTIVAHIAQALGCDAIWLATGDGEPYVKGISTGIAGDLTVAAVAFAKRWQALSPALQAKVADVLVAYESLAESEAPEPEPIKGRKRPAAVT